LFSLLFTFFSVFRPLPALSALLLPFLFDPSSFFFFEHRGLIVADATSADGTRLLQEFPTDGRPYSVFIVDPLGNLMMSYDSRQNPKGLLEDLQKLLRLSHIG